MCYSVRTPFSFRNYIRLSCPYCVRRKLWEVDVNCSYTTVVHQLNWSLPSMKISHVEDCSESRLTVFILMFLRFYCFSTECIQLDSSAAPTIPVFPLFGVKMFLVLSDVCVHYHVILCLFVLLWHVCMQSYAESDIGTVRSKVWSYWEVDMIHVLYVVIIISLDVLFAVLFWLAI